MKDCAAALHRAYYQRLSVSGLWPCYDRPPGTAKHPFNLIESVTTIDDSDKTTRRQIATVQISANISYTGDAGGKKEVEDQASLICEIIDDRSNRIDCISDFHIITTRLESATTIEEPRNDPSNLVRRILRFKHIVEEL